MKKTYRKSLPITIIQILGLVADIVGIISFARKLIVESSIQIASFVCILLLLVIFVLLIVFWKRIHVFLLTTILNLFSPDNTKELHDKTVVYEYLSRSVMRFHSSFSIKVRHGTIDRYCDRLLWTAGPISNISAIVPNQTVRFLNEPSIHQISLVRQNFEIKFNNCISSNEPHPTPTGFSIEKLEDPKMKAIPHLVVGVYDVTKGLTIRVVFPGNMEITNCRFEHYAHFIDENPYNIEEAEPILFEQNAKKYLEMKIKRPIYGGKYAIRWEFTTNDRS